MTIQELKLYSDVHSLCLCLLYLINVLCGLTAKHIGAPCLGTSGAVYKLISSLGINVRGNRCYDNLMAVLMKKLHRFDATVH